ncbi:MAG TPA: tetratricopeptide repeat protein [Vicinamibacterales bacterium]|nr:tetratricopeptide repeat protein [Vicinamibacterales bacterium]
MPAFLIAWSLIVSFVPAAWAQTPADPRVAAARALDYGRYDEVHTLVADLRTDATTAVLRARAYVAVGRYDDAAQILQAAYFENPLGDAAVELGILQRMLGRREALRTLTLILSRDIVAGTAPEYLRAGRAARALGRFQQANDYFREAVAQAPTDVAANVAWGELFLEKHNRTDAAKSFQAALRTDGENPAALMGMARTVADDNPPLARKLAQQVLAINPQSAAARVLLAELALDDTKRPEAKAELEKALDVNPNHFEALSLSAAVAWLEKRTADYEATTAALLKLNPTYGEVFRVVGAQSARNYRFEEAAELARKAITIDRGNTRAFADLGAHLMRTGDERGARRALEAAFRVDPYDVVTYNLLGLLDTLDGFETIREGDMVIRLHPDEVGVMREYVPALAREALAALSKRWDFTPTGPILIEMFPRHDDFAVRNVGLPGMIGALGACFGKVVTLDSPKARPPGEFNWGATLWHELAHVITIQLSNQRVPRWLTEGISVWEETRARAAWGREMEVTFAGAINRGQVMKLRDLNAGFSNPETISLAYYQASLLVEHIVQRFSEASLRELVRVFSEDVDTETAITRVLKVDVGNLQTSFDAFLDERFGTLRRALVTPEGFSPDLPLERLRPLAEANPGSFPVQMAFGRALEANDAAAALAVYQKAAVLVPQATGDASPQARLADLFAAQGDKAAAARALEALTTADHQAVASARQLVSLLDPGADGPRRRAALAKVVAIDPFDAAAHSELGRYALADGSLAEAIRSFRVAVAAGATDRAGAYADLGEALEKSGAKDDAKRQALLALEVAPTYPRAQDLLLRIVEPPQ